MLTKDWCGHFVPVFFTTDVFLASSLVNAEMQHRLLLSCMFQELTCFCSALDIFLLELSMDRLHLFDL